MVAFYADENVQYVLADELRLLGHDVLTAGEDGRAGQGIEDEDVLARAIELDRTVITNDRDDYRRLHRMFPNHSGIVTYTKDSDIPALAARIDAAIAVLPSLHGQLVKIIRPNP
jgi:uncharacterized protein with PIN domain